MNAEPLLEPVAAEDVSRPPPSRGDGKGKRTLIILFVVLMIQRFQMMMSFSFLPESELGVEMTGFQQGVVFASFSIGSVIVSPFIGQVLALLKTRNTIALGLISMIVLILLFGAVPSLVSGPRSATLAFGICGLLYGGTSTLGGMGAYSMITHIGVIRGYAASLIALAEVTVGIGAMLGPVVGGALFSVAGVHLGLDAGLQFLFPFITTVIFPVGSLVMTLLFVPNEAVTSGSRAKSKCGGGPCTLRHVVLGLAIISGGLMNGALRPTMEIHLKALDVPAERLSTTTGLLLMVAGGMYMLFAYPLGRLLDKGCCMRRRASEECGYTVPREDLVVAESSPSPAATDNGHEQQQQQQQQQQEEEQEQEQEQEQEGPIVEDKEHAARAHAAIPMACKEGESEKGEEGEREEREWEKSCCCGVAPNSALTPMVMVGTGSICLVLAGVIVAPLKLGALDLAAMQRVPVVVLGLVMLGVGMSLLIVPGMPALLIGVAKDDEVGQARATGMFGAFFFLGSTTGTLVSEQLMAMEVPFLCRPDDWPANTTATTLAAAASLSSSTTSAIATHAPTYDAWQGNGNGNGNSNHSVIDPKQHCFDGTFTVLALFTLLACLANWTYFLFKRGRFP